MTLELVIFILVAAVAIFSAALMLVSRNAVHSALFLVTNFLCVAFFYLLLNAPFLAMIQVTVYAGAIMVLFMFVIMLLGADQLSAANTRYTWLVPAAVGLTTLFLIVAFVAIAQGNVDLLQPIPQNPQVRFVNAAAGAAPVDVYFNNDRVAHSVAYGTSTGFTEVKPGKYNALVFAACTETDLTRCADPLKLGTAPLLAAPIAVGVDPNVNASTFVVAGTIGQLQLINSPMNLSSVDDETTMRLTVVDALPGTTGVYLAQIDPTDQTNLTQISPNLNYGDPGLPITLNSDTYNMQWVGPNKTRIVAANALTFKPKTAETLILAPEITAGQTVSRPTVIRVDPVPPTEEAFGSPQQIGQSLLSTFLLPFELVSLLLLAAMVGAIILTREEVAKRVRQRLVVSPVVSRINRSVAANLQQSASVPSGETQPTAAGGPAEASAD